MTINKSNKRLIFSELTLEEITSNVRTELEPRFDELMELVKPNDPLELLTPKEVSELLKVDPSTLHNWCKKGKLKKYGLGYRTYYKIDEIMSALIPLN